MVLNTLELKNITNKILPAVDSSEISRTTETLELYVQDSILYICVTNKEYFVKVKLFLGMNENFHASVNANTFLNLISQITTEDIELTCDEKSLHIKGNGNYKLPLICDTKTGELLKLDRIQIENPTVNMSIETSILNSILKHNSKEISKGFVQNPVQKMYYVDENGAITFTTGACVNKFSLEKPVKMLLNNKIVKLFKLFTGDRVNFTLGQDALSNDIIQTKVCFEDDIIQLTAILQCDDTMLRSVPVNNIVGRVDYIYPYSININKTNLIQAINRLILLNGKTATNVIISKFEFNAEGITISNMGGENTEVIPYMNICESLRETPYVANFDLNDIKITLSTCEDNYLTFNFGNKEALVIARTNIFNIIPECPEF